MSEFRSNRMVLDNPLGLKRFLEQTRRPKQTPGERCEMCGEPIAPDHSHIVNVETRALMCACRGCYLLFTHSGAAGGKYRAVPANHRYDPDFSITDAQWDDLQIPVRMAFFFHNSTLDRFVAFYPSPAGATESLLLLDTWSAILAGNPAFGVIEPDVEALILNRRESRRPNGAIGAAAAEPEVADATECYLAPISECYELVGLVRLHWRGFGGGEEVWREIDRFFAQLREKSFLVAPRE